MRSRKYIGGIAATAAAVLVLSACGGTDDTSTATGDPIVVAAVSTLSGPATWPEAAEAAKAVFDKYNADGGLDGRPIEYHAYDDKGDPATAGQVAREAVGLDSVAMVGSASLLDCEINHGYYEENGILAIQGTGVDPFCFSTPNISPVNTGPYVDTELTLTYGSEVLGLENVCGLLSIEGSTRPAYQEAIDRWSDATGKTMNMIDDTLTYSIADYTPYVVQAKKAGCDALFSNTVEPGYVGLLNAAETQGLDVTFLFLTSGYSTEFAQAANYVGKGVYVPAEFLPYGIDGLEGNEDWQALMEENDIDQTAFAQGGYLAAKHFIELIEGLDGDVTRESVSEALMSMDKPIESPMTGSPWTFGSGDRHNANLSGWPIAIMPGENEWKTVADDWIHSSKEN